MTQMRKEGKRQFPSIHPYLYLLIPILGLSLFINKAFHIDDPTFIRMGLQLPWTVLGDAGGPVDFLGIHYPDLSPYESTHPVLIPYLLKIAHLFQPAHGAPRFWAYHLFFLIFPLLILLFSARLASVCGMTAHWGWFLIFSPVFFVNATNLMTDAAMTTFWMGSVFLSVAYSYTASKRDAWGAGLCLVLALLTSYQSVALFPLISVYFWIRRDLNRVTLTILGAPLILLVLYLLAVYQLSGFLPFIASSIDLNIAGEVSSGMDGQAFLHKTLAVLVNLGLGFLALTPAWFFTSKWSRSLACSVLAICLTVLASYLGKDMLEGYSSGQMWLLWSLMLNGSFWVAAMLLKFLDGVKRFTSNRRRSAWLLLAGFWFFGVLVYNILFLPYGTARYIMPALPPALMLLFAGGSFRYFQGLSWPILALSVLASLFMARVDYGQAEADFTLYERVSDADYGGTVWYSDDAGLIRYMPLIDGQYLTLDQQTIEVGDKVLMTRGLIPEALAGDLTLREVFEIPSFGGWSLFNTTQRAGFYRSYDGFLPIWRAPLARKAHLFEVNFFQKNRDLAQPMEMDNPNYFGYRTFAFPNGESLGVMFMHPKARVGFPINDQLPSQLTGRVVTAPGSWEKDGDGVLCTVGVFQNGEEKILWELEIDGKNREEDRKPTPFSIPIPAGSTLIWFQVGPGPKGDSRYDSMGWSDLRLEVYK